MQRLLPALDVCFAVADERLGALHNLQSRAEQAT
jgi:hypothetical protein